MAQEMPDTTITEGSKTPADADPNADSAKRRQILEGARTVFRANGYDGASVDSIAKTAGVSKGTIYVYFDSKEELFKALILEERLDQAELVLQLDAQYSDFKEALRQLGRNYGEAVVRPGKISTMRMVVGAAEKFPQFGALVYEAGPCQGIKRVSEYFKTHIAAGDLRECDTDVAAGHFFDLCVAQILRRMLLIVGDTPSQKEIFDTVDRGIEVFLAAYGKK